MCIEHASNPARVMATRGTATLEAELDTFGEGTPSASRDSGALDAGARGWCLGPSHQLAYESASVVDCTHGHARKHGG